MAIDCKCEPCPFDIRDLGYKTAKEDAAFEGTQCMWHEQVVGSKGIIFLSGGTATEPLFISVAKDGVYITENFGLNEVRAEASRIGAKLK